MMKTKKTKQKYTKNSNAIILSGGGGLKRINKLDLRLVIPVVVMVAVIGGYMMFRSFAGSPQTYINYNIPEANGKDTRSVFARTGTVCVRTNFYTLFFGKKAGSGVGRASYRIDVQQYTSGRWVKVRTTDRYSANSNRDYQCFSGLARGSYYRSHIYKDGGGAYSPQFNIGGPFAMEGR